MKTDPGDIQNVSDTARWVAFYRAMESERPDAIFRDPWARRLAGDRGEAMVRTMPRGRQMAWAMIVRTAVMDEVISRLVGQGADLVLNLAAGLDARPWRLDLPAELRWVDVDLPGILGYKTATLAGAAPRCRYEAVHADLTDEAVRDAVFARIGSEAQRVLVVTEGLLVYLDPAEVRSLAGALHAQPSFRWWLTDLMAQRLMARLQRLWGKQLGKGNAPFRFAPAEGAAFFEPLGWREAEWRSSVGEGARLRREMAGMWLWRAFTRLLPRGRREEFSRLAGFLLLENVGP